MPGSMTPGRSRADDIAAGLRAGSLEVRLARTRDEVAAAQALRYRVFYQEMSARPNAAMAAARRDFDDFDAICDHLLALDHDAPAALVQCARGRSGPVIVGTFRLLRRSVARRFGGVYSADEYDIARLGAVEATLL